MADQKICNDPCQEIHLQVTNVTTKLWRKTFKSSMVLHVQIGHSTDEQSRMQNKKGRGVLMMFLKHKIQVTTTRWSVKIELFTSSYEKHILSTLFFRSSYPFLTMTAEIGGYLGLILGVSLIHLVQALRGAMQLKEIEIKLVTHWNETEGKQIQHSVIFLFQVKFTIFKQFRFRDNTHMFSTD